MRFPLFVFVAATGAWLSLLADEADPKTADSETAEVSQTSADGLFFRISYRRNDSKPWTFYADVTDLDHAGRIEALLKRIGYEADVQPMTGTPRPAVSTPPPPAPPPPEWFTNPRPVTGVQPRARAASSARGPVAANQRPGHRSSVFAQGNSSITSRWTPYVGIGGGFVVNIPTNPMTAPQLNTSSLAGGRPVRAGHPTVGP